MGDVSVNQGVKKCWAFLMGLCFFGFFLAQRIVMYL